MVIQAKKFQFCGYTVSAPEGKITFEYRIEFVSHDPISFVETIFLPEKIKQSKRSSIKKFLEPLGIILGISYYKLYCPSEIQLPFGLSKKQAEFWNTVYRKGLGEFLYKNKISPDQVAKFSYEKISSRPLRVSVPQRALMGIGGGKDSIVAAELLKEFETASFVVETQREDPISNRVAEALGRPVIKIRRFLDPKILKSEHFEGSYNGHVPISAVFAFLGLLAAYVYDYEYVVVANECSSNFGNTDYCGETINHQWSKSSEFETLLQEYTKEYITPDITYYSLLRQFYEIRIAKMFAKQDKYFDLFSSCNRNFTVFKGRPDSLWCGECPKCTFVFLMLAPFLSKEKLLKIFHKNLFTDNSLFPLFRDLLGFGEAKPFDCVGTFEESRVALSLAAKKFPNDLVIQEFLPQIGDTKVLEKKVLSTVPAPTLPTPFRFLGIESVCILGHGKEGKITEQYLKKYFSHLAIGILDKSLDPNYLEKQSEYDLAIKTPGIQSSKVVIPYTTATNLFFSTVKNLTIGVTGSKGKSTTTNLIFEILKADKRKVRLLGNIGTPMLSTLLETVDPEEIFVLELSSYMLEDIEYSPHIALLLNLFPEHLNYHGSASAYYRAKKNIFRFQKKGDLAFRPPFSGIQIPLVDSEIPLLGEHNRENIRAAIAVCRALGVSDSTISQALKDFHPLPHRLELVGRFHEISFYDDAISTTPESTIAAITALKNVGTIFLGGEDRGYDFRELEKTLREYHIQNIVLFPDTGRRILRSREGFRILETQKMEEAVAFAFDHTPKGKICLLSTASPSYSLWKNFEEKGDHFQKCVKEMGEKEQEKMS